METKPVEIGSIRCDCPECRRAGDRAERLTLYGVLDAEGRTRIRVHGHADPEEGTLLDRVIPCACEHDALVSRAEWARRGEWPWQGELWDFVPA